MLWQKQKGKQLKSKTKKQRANKYDEKLAVNASFAEVFKVIRKNKEEKKK